MGLGPNLDLQICILQVSNFANQINLTLSNLISFYNLALRNRRSDQARYIPKVLQQ